MSDQNGQALVFAVLLLGLAAVAAVGARDAAQRLLAAVQDERAGEAAVAAAGAAVADLRLRRASELGRELDAAEVAALAGSAEAVAAARAAARRVARAQGRGDPDGVTLRAFGHEIEVHLTLAGHRHIALLVAAP